MRSTPNDVTFTNKQTPVTTAFMLLDTRRKNTFIPTYTHIMHYTRVEHNMRTQTQRKTAHADGQICAHIYTQRAFWIWKNSRPRTRLRSRSSRQAYHKSKAKCLSRSLLSRHCRRKNQNWRQKRQIWSRVCKRSLGILKRHPRN